MTTPDPREDALAKQALELAKTLNDDPWLDLELNNSELATAAAIILLALRTAQSESYAGPDLHTPFVPCRLTGESVTEWVFEDVAHIAQPAFPGLYHFIDELVAMDDRRLVGVQFWGPPPSPTPYVRPAAEIQAEIERVNSWGNQTKSSYRDGLTFALTPPSRSHADDRR